jgi:hypothetical protein
MRLHVRVALAASILLALAAAACGQPVATGGGASVPVAPVDVSILGVTCDGGSFPQFESLAADAVLVRATRCLYGKERVSGDGEWATIVAQEATSGLDVLAIALRLPSPTTVNEECRGEFAPVVITVTDAAGRQFAPAIPHQCSGPRPEVVAAINGLQWTTTKTSRIQRVRTELEVTTGCDGTWKPVIALIATGGPGEPRSTVDTTPRPLTVCRYKISTNADAALKLSDGRELHAGELVSSSPLDSPAAASLLQAVAAAPPADKNCQPAEVGFAVVSDHGWGGQWVAIELSGCYRASVGFEDPLRQLDAATVARLLP